MSEIIAKDTDCIPEGIYCYQVTSEDGRREYHPCLYWSLNPDEDYMNNGHCSYLEQGDWEVDGVSLLWDGCKECGIKMGDDYE